MAVDSNTMPPVYLHSIREGSMGKERSFCEEVCGSPIENPSGISGKVLYYPSYVTLPKLETKGGKMGLPPLTASEPMEDQISEAEYHATDYEGFAKIPEERQVQGEAYGEKTLEHFIKRSHIVANTKEDYDFAALLASPTANQTYAVGTSWANGGGSPFKDIRTVLRTKSPDANLIIFARDVADELALHDEMIGRVANFSGGGGLSNAELAAAIQSQFTGVEVRVFDRYYNAAQRGTTTLTRTYLFAGGVWIGKKEGLLYVKPNMGLDSAIGTVANDALRVYRDEDLRADCIKWVKYSHPGLIPDTAFACTLTGAIA